MWFLVNMQVKEESCLGMWVVFSSSYFVLSYSKFVGISLIYIASLLVLHQWTWEWIGSESQNNFTKIYFFRAHCQNQLSFPIPRVHFGCHISIWNMYVRIITWNQTWKQPDATFFPVYCNKCDLFIRKAIAERFFSHLFFLFFWLWFYFHIGRRRSVRHMPGQWGWKRLYM